MKITKRFNRVIKPFKKPINCSTSDPKSQILKVKPNLKTQKSKTKSKIKFDINLQESKPTFVLEKSQILGPEFYQIDALDLAPKLLGKYLKKDDVVLQITEVLDKFISYLNIVMCCYVLLLCMVIMPYA